MGPSAYIMVLAAISVSQLEQGIVYIGLGLSRVGKPPPEECLKKIHIVVRI